MSESKKVYRISVIYDDKKYFRARQVGGCSFVRGFNKEGAEKIIHDLVSARIVANGFPADCFRLESVEASEEEAAFYLEHRHNKDYKRGLVN